jgi:hypothetical protein
MKKILVSSALALSVFCFLESPSAKAQDVSFFPNAYSRPSEEVEGIGVGTRNGADLFAPTAGASASAVAAQRHRIGHVTH